MRIFTILFVLSVTLFCGCASEHFVAGRGDAGQFILQQAILRGGNPTTTNNLPAIDTAWGYLTNNCGVVVRLPRQDFSSVELFLYQSFGEPEFGPPNANGARAGKYKFAGKDGGIQFSCDINWTRVTIFSR